MRAPSRIVRRVVLACAGLAVIGTVAPVTAAYANGQSRPAPASYLALGDSVPFGYREAANTPPPDYADAASFVGYPEDVAANLGLRVANASCPGETTGSFLDVHAQSNGCENAVGSTQGYRSFYPLHVAYRGTQLGYAVRYLRSHPRTRLVSLGIGANDEFVCEATTADKCASEFPALLKRIGRNVHTILARMRHRAGYRGPLVVVDYYSLDYADAQGSAGTRALNAALAGAARPFGARIADGYGTFERAAVQAGGDTCAAGLLTTLATGGCGVHPSVAGQALLAQALEQARR